MNRMIQVIYEDNVLKPLIPIEGMKSNEIAWIFLYPSSEKTKLNELIGTLTKEEAEEMQSCIDKEFSHIEGEW